jgi:pimeloyl-ACP methyl ester carboxylesterase
MDALTTRMFTLTRVVALALIALLVAGLAYLRFAPDSSAVSAPVGAKGGDLILEPCEYPTENGNYAADCGTLVVPEKRADPQSRLIAVPVTRIHAKSDQPREPIFLLQGGPGITNMSFDKVNRYAGDHDVVLVGYRGVDGSVRLDCPEVESALRHSTDLLSEKTSGAYADAYRACAQRLSSAGVDLGSYGIAQQVDDMEAARAALGYDRIDLLSESAGTRTAIIYSWRYPESIHRSVMIGVNPPGHFLWDPRTTDEQIDRYAALCAQDDSCRARTDDLAAALHRTDAEIPDRWLFLPIKKGNVRVLSFFGLMESSPAAPVASGPTIIDMWLSAAEGDASALWSASFFGDVLFPRAFVAGQYAAFGRADAHAARDYFSAGERDDGTNIGRATTSYVWGNGGLVDAWAAAPDESEYSQVRTSNVETLLIGGELDFSTPPQVATKELLPYLPNGHEVVLPGIGHTASIFAEQADASSRLINTFFDTGKVDDSLYSPQSVDFTPAKRFGDMAKIFLGLALALAVVTVVSLVWMAWWVHKRSRFGGKASAVLRSAYSIILGVGGWFFGALIALATMPGVPIDDELLVALSVGLPVGLGIYLAWVHRDWTAQSKGLGLAASVAGALVGGWLGFHATGGLMALMTAILGAVAGGNLVLILLDMVRAGSADDRVASGTAADTRQKDIRPEASAGAGERLDSLRVTNLDFAPSAGDAKLE